MSVNSSTSATLSSSLQKDEEGYQEIPSSKTLGVVEDSVEDNTSDDDDKEAKAGDLPRLDSNDYHYNWRYYVPTGTHCINFVRWFIVGGAAYAEPQSEEELEESLQGLAKCLLLIRKYLSIYGMPTGNLVRDQEYVLREICRDLYAGGAPLWALEPVMQKAAEGLTGERHVNWMLFPRKAYVYNPGSDTTNMFSIERGFNITKMDAMEKVAVRLATFASNVQAVVSIPSRLPNLREFDEARTSVTIDSLHGPKDEDYNTHLANQILELASGGKGLFYYVNSSEYKGDASNSSLEDDEANAVRQFWTVTEEERELFTRLACDEAIRAISEVDKTALRTKQTSPWLLVAFRAIASAGTCVFWFDGGWWDMLVSAVLAILVSLIGTSSIVSKQERLIYETVASLLVGLIAGMISLSFPDHTCYSAMALSGVLDILQGFRVVYSIIEIMSKHTVSGVADLFEGILFTQLIAYFLRIGQYSAVAIYSDMDLNNQFKSCHSGIDDHWFALFVPLAALAWSGLFNPKCTADLLVMALHGILAYTVNYYMSEAGVNVELNSFVSAAVVSFSAGVLSRFTGRQAVGNTSAGMYVLVPGAYMVSSLTGWGAVSSDFFTSIITRAIAIGVGGWTGTILCSPAVLGTTRGLIWQSRNLNLGVELSHLSQHGFGSSERSRRRSRDTGIKVTGNATKSQPNTMLYF